jgi:Fe-S-cluster containining protein
VNTGSLAACSDADIEALIEEIHQRRANINLGLPYRRETVALFLELFTCQRCGLCCLGDELGNESGVILSPAEVEMAAAALSISRNRFKRVHTYVNNEARIMRYPCLFNAPEGHACLIYHKRPAVCRTFPLHAPLRAPNGTYLMVVAGICPEGRRVAAHLLRLRRDMEKKIAGMSEAEKETLMKTNAEFWTESRQAQAQSGWFKDKT